MDREIWWGEEVDSRSFTRKLVVEMQQAAARNQIDPHLVTIWWNPNDWNIRAVIKPDEGGITKLSLSFLARWQVVLEFDDDLLLRLTDDNIAKVQNDVAGQLSEAVL